MHIRLGSLKVAELFLSRPEVTAALKAAGASCERIDRLLWGGEVASDLFAMFRQGEGWAEGVEHMLFIAENERSGRRPHIRSLLSFPPLAGS